MFFEITKNSCFCDVEDVNSFKNVFTVVVRPNVIPNSCTLF